MWLLVTALVVLLALLAALQYRWTGEIGRAEAERQRARLERATQRFARELGRELSRVVLAFGPERPDREPEDPRRSFLQRLERWQTSEHAALVSRLVLVTHPDSGPLLAEAATPETLEFEPIPPPPGLEVLSEQLQDTRGGRPLRERFRGDALLQSPPSLLLPVIRRPGDNPFDPDGARLGGWALIELSEPYLRETLLPGLAEIHFGPLDDGDYAVAVLRRDDGSVLYGSDPDLGPEEMARPDMRLPVPEWPGWPGGPIGGDDRRPRFGEPPPSRDGPPGRRPVDLAPLPDGPRPPGPPVQDFGPGPPRPDPAGPAAASLVGPGGVGAPWVLVVRHRGGSLGHAVRAARLRNLAVGLGILGLLGISGVLLAVGAQRARSLARQQLEFVAGVTHELHTPLAAIGSAGQNLADGVVRDPEQIRRYGDLIQKEGHRLGALVAQVLDFAGIESGSRVYTFEAVPVRALVDGVVGDLRLVLEQAGMTVEVEVPDDLPDVRADPAALRRALENLLVNAAKFAPSGGWVRVSATPGSRSRTLELRVEDRGPGLPRDEHGRVFEPFYRGRDARLEQAPGSGLGLSLVRHVVEAHGGRVRAETRDGGGLAVAMELPVETGHGRI